jgi:hypothetical protein
MPEVADSPVARVSLHVLTGLLYKPKHFIGDQLGTWQPDLREVLLFLLFFVGSCLVVFLSEKVTS